MTGPTEEERSYEQLVHELEACVRDLEEGKLPLERAIGRFKEGIALVKSAERRLQVAEGQVTLLLQSEEGGEQVQTFAAPTAAEPPPAGPRLGTSVNTGRPVAALGRTSRPAADDDIPF